MKVLDTTFLVDLLKNRPEVNKVINTSEVLATTIINMYEIMVGLFHEGVSHDRYFEIMDIFRNISLLPLDEDAVVQAAKISAEMMKKGTAIEDKDCLIAGIALSRGISIIITKNKKDFERIKGIKVETY